MDNHPHQAEISESGALRASELSYRRLFEAAQDGILILEADSGRITDANPFLFNLLGFSRRELIGRTVGELSPFKDIESNQAMLERLQQHGFVRYDDLPLETKDGHTIAVEFVSNVYQAGDKNVIQCNIRDITERKKSEEQLKLLNTCISNLEDIVVITEASPLAEPGPKIVFVNEAFERITGYTSAEALGRSPHFLQGENTDRRVLTEIRQAMARKQPIRRQVINYKKDGSEYWMDACIVPVFDAKGTCSHFAAIERDITETKRREEALNLFRILMDRSPDAIEIVDPQTGRFLDVNETACRRLGYSREEMLSLSIPDTIDVGENPFSMKTYMDEVRKSGVKIIEGRHRRKDGSTFPSEVNVQYIDLHGGYLVAVVRDITERKKNEARFRRLVDSNAQGVIFWNTKGQITGANDAFLQMVGYTRKDLESGGLNWLAMTPPEYTELDCQCLQKIAATGSCAPYEKEYFRKDNSRVAVLIGAASFEDSPQEGLCFVIDLTEPKKLEQQFLRAQRMESIGTLAGGIAHDLNNILAPIMMSIDMLKLTATDPQAKSILETIEVSSRRGADIVRQVLSFARGVEGERMEIQLGHLLKEIKTIIRDTFPKNIQLQFSIPPDTWMILGDPTQVHQILLNLCVNARDAMPNGGTLEVSVENCVLDEHYAAMNNQARAGRYVNINLRDSGVGIPPEILDKIFDPFFTTKEAGKGTGLGLSTAAAIVKSHEGILNVYSKPGRGTTFKVYLPAMELSPEGQRDRPKPALVPRGNGETILIVDDEVSILAITSQTLQAFGYQVLVASDGAEAVAVYAQNSEKISVVLTDMDMPVMDGPATIRALIRIDPLVKIIAASGFATNGNHAKGCGASVRHFLTKPYTAGTLLKMIRALLEERRPKMNSSIESERNELEIVTHD